MTEHAGNEHDDSEYAGSQDDRTATYVRTATAERTGPDGSTGADGSTGQDGAEPEEVAVVRACMESYMAQDRDRAEQLIAADYRFTSPQDDGLDRAGFFARCFPTADRFRAQEIRSLVPAGDGDVYLMYEYELRTGERHRNVEVATVRDGLLVETQVFFGGRVN